MSKAIAFVLGVVAAGALFFLGNYLGLIPSPQSAMERALATRIESIPIEKVCESIALIFRRMCQVARNS